jgi:hypothetical protein
MRCPFLLSVGAAAVVAAGALTTSSDAAGPRFFQMPSHNIFCAYVPPDARSPAALRCDILSGLRPEPKTSCDLDWTGASLSVRGKASASCAGDTVAMPKARVLAYGTTWKVGGFTCLSRTTGLRCTNRGGHGLFLSRERWRVW